MQVLKFGGTSVANAENIQKATLVVKNSGYNRSVVIVSALSGVTDLLIKTGTIASEGNELYKQHLIELEKKHIDTVRNLLPVTSQSACLSLVKTHFNELEDICEGVYRLKELSGRTKDRVVSYGELLSSKIISAYFSSLSMEHEWIDSRQVITTNSHFGHATVDFESTNQHIRKAIQFSGSRLFIAPGFIASDSKGQTTTLGRGGSDYTAAIFAAAINAETLEIWTDVSGMMTADPRWVSNAKPIPHISYKEAMELSHFGAKVIYPPTIQPAMQKNIPIWIKNTFKPEDYGTLIESDVSKVNLDIVTGISSINQITLLSLEGSGMVGIPGFSKRLFESLAFERINVILITQSSSEHSISVAINSIDAAHAKKVIDHAFENEILSNKLEPIKVEQELSIVAVVGDNMKSHPGISGKMFSALGRNGVNIRAIAQGSSEKNISAVISQADAKKAVNVLHEAFFESTYKQVNVFIVGAGNVGAKLIGQLHQQEEYLLNELNLQLRVVGISNSKKSLIRKDGINLANWEEDLQKKSEPTHIAELIKTIIDHNLRNTVFVDVTGNEEVSQQYTKLLQKSISVVACNKIAAASSLANYLHLKATAKEFNVKFLYETNVGASLPVIGTLNDLVRSGDKVTRIQAVLSGTLNFVFNNYDGTSTFSSVVRQAQKEGYTEPDPRLDLGGTDVMRKILILAREAGQHIEMSDITNNGFLPEPCFAGSVEDFYKTMEEHEDHFKKLYTAANEKGCKLKFVASYENGKAAVGLQHVPADSDFFHLYGKDNIVLFYTKRYPEQPLVVKGAGAGADVTASGVFADIIRVAP